ncbi:chain length determinant protein tyrosine kinase EpsG [Noviherbaspirillum humi]|uniref:Chain length determinant protein tyrosine kinase EpsG n=1 Tax=Noviherbaspirillum humi TaxID=1688639 RepID=A0A239C336_9BURK|nr:cellulose synthase operon protein YhjQ/BcsQ [Noviherbaspirillum humi]SNS14586.1 chain length determinant protein tyrosine kinase EpsG [Noviherbaspirillum humi]
MKKSSVIHVASPDDDLPATAAAINPAEAAPRPKLGQLLLEAGKLRAIDIERVLQLQVVSRLAFGEAAVQLQLVAPEDVEHMLARQFGCPQLLPGEGGYASELVSAYAPLGPQAEALTRFATCLTQRWFAGGRRELALCGIEPGSGASLLAANLAVIFARRGARTLLVDADLRAPCQHRIFNLAQRRGLADAIGLRGDDDIACELPELPGLSVIAAGNRPPNPQQLLARPAFGQLMEDCVRRFDVVLYDTPAFTSAADIFAVAARAGGVVLVARRDATPAAELRRAADYLGRANASVVAAMLNRF